MSFPDSPHPVQPIPVQQAAWKAWLPVVSLSFASFIFVTTEFLPVGLLTDIAKDLDRTESQIGLLLTGYAWVVAIMSLPLTLVVAKVERRKLLLSLLIIFMAAHVVAGFAHSYWMLAASRTGIALAHSIFWAITTPLAARLAPEGKKAYGLAIIVVGGSLASVLGIPIGTTLGKLLHWQTAFLIVGAGAAVVFVILALMLPRLPATNAGSLRHLPDLLRRGPLMVCYILTALAITGEFVAYSYIEPFSQKVGGFPDEIIVAILFVFGASGIIGGFLNARLAPKAPRLMMFAPLALVAICLAFLQIAAPHLTWMLLICLIWGGCMTVVMLSLQLRIMALAPDATDIAMAIFSAIFNLGIGSGALLGGRIIDTMGYGMIGYVGAIFLTVSLFIAVPTLWASLRKTESVPATVTN